MPYFLVETRRILGGFQVAVRGPAYASRRDAEELAQPPAPVGTRGLEQVLAQLPTEAARQSLLANLNAARQHTRSNVIEAGDAAEAERLAEREALRHAGREEPAIPQYFLMLFRSVEREGQPIELQARMELGPLGDYDEAVAQFGNAERYAQWDADYQAQQRERGDLSTQVNDWYCIVKAGDEQQAVRQEGMVLGPTMSKSTAYLQNHSQRSPSR